MHTQLTTQLQNSTMEPVHNTTSEPLSNNVVVTTGNTQSASVTTNATSSGLSLLKWRTPQWNQFET